MRRERTEKDIRKGAGKRKMGRERDREDGTNKEAGGERAYERKNRNEAASEAEKEKWKDTSLDKHTGKKKAHHYYHQHHQRNWARLPSRLQLEGGVTMGNCWNQYQLWLATAAQSAMMSVRGEGAIQQHWLRYQTTCGPDEGKPDILQTLIRFSWTDRLDASVCVNLPN